MSFFITYICLSFSSDHEALGIVPKAEQLQCLRHSYLPRFFVLCHFAKVSRVGATSFRGSPVLFAFSASWWNLSHQSSHMLYFHFCTSFSYHLAHRSKAGLRPASSKPQSCCVQQLFDYPTNSSMHPALITLFIQLKTQDKCVWTGLLRRCRLTVCCICVMWFFLISFAWISSYRNLHLKP